MIVIPHNIFSQWKASIEKIYKGDIKCKFITENKVDCEWIGMNGTPTGMSGYYHENVALIIHSIKNKK